MDERTRGAAEARPGDRHRAREAALKVLYLWEVGGGEVAEALRTFRAIDLEDEERPSPAVEPFIRSLVVGTAEALDQIDPLIAAAAEHWRLERMAVIDRLVLRMAVYELRSGDSPAAVVINEALELARTYSGDDAVGFVNGVLDAVRKRLAPDSQPPTTTD